MATRKRTKKQTLPEFRAWLEGMEEIQPEDWAPTAAQWKTIREKINNVVEQKASIDEAKILKMIESVGEKAVTNNTPSPHPGNPYGQPQVAHPPPPPAGGIPSGPVEVAPAAQSFAPPAKPVDLTEVAKPKESDGNYESSFI